MGLELPGLLLLCHENRGNWIEGASIAWADEAARWLAPQYELDFVRKLVADAGFAFVDVPLSGLDSGRACRLLRDTPRPMLWNITDGIGAFIGSLAPSMAHLLGVPFLGSSTYVQGLCQYKHHWRVALEASGVHCLPGALIRQGTAAEADAVSTLSAPLFVKPAALGNNAGFASVPPMSDDAEQAMTKARSLLAGGLGPVLVEEFAPGDEYAVWAFHTGDWRYWGYRKRLAAPFATNAIKDSEHQWTRSGAGGPAAHFDEDASPELLLLTWEIISALDIKDYVRIEFRRHRDDRLYPIDINTGAFFTSRSFEAAATALEGGSAPLLRTLIGHSYSRQIATGSLQPAHRPRPD